MKFELGVKYLRKTQTLVVIVKTNQTFRVIHMNHDGVNVKRYKASVTA